MTSNIGDIKKSIKSVLIVLSNILVKFLIILGICQLQG